MPAASHTVSKPAVAVFTGAGASVTFGYPLTSQLLPGILARLADGSLFGEDGVDEREALAGALRALFPGLPIQRDVTEVAIWITDILSLLDQALQSGTALHPRLRPEQLRRCRELLGRALFEVLVAAGPHPAQQRFHGWIERLVREGHVGVVSTNYDLTVDQPLLDARGKDASSIDFGFDWRDAGDNSVHPRPRQPTLGLYKLHGSLNWLRCELCEHVYVNPYGTIAHQAFLRERTEWNTCDCGGSLGAQLVAPSLVRDVRDPTLLGIWKSALELMRRAEHWCFIGYSLPAEDVAIRALLLRAYHARETPPRVTVVQLGSRAQPQYELLFPGCTYHDKGLVAFLDGLDANAEAQGGGETKR